MLRQWECEIRAASQGLACMNVFRFVPQNVMPEPVQSPVYLARSVGERFKSPAHLISGLFPSQMRAKVHQFKRLEEDQPA